MTDAEAGWKLNSRGFIVLTRAGEEECVASEKIFRAQHPRGGSWPDAELRQPSQYIPGLAFAPFELHPHLTLRQDRDGFWSPWLVATTPFGSFDLSDAQGSDQIIHNGIWFAVNSERHSKALGELREVGAQLGAPLTANQFLSLVWNFNIALDDRASAKSQFLDSRRDAVPVSALVRASLYPYQAAGISRLVEMYDRQLGTLLADEMGLGKTIQVIAVLAHASTISPTPSLVVCPSSLTENWRREIARFSPQLRVMTHQGRERTAVSQNFAHYDVVVTSYDTCLRDSSVLSQVQWNVLACDEAQMIKNPDSQRALTLGSILRRTTIAVTGTPIENSLRDLWSIMSLVAPTLLRSLEEFSSDYPDDSVAASKLSTRVSPLVLRRSVKDVAADLPPKIEVHVPLQLPEEHRGEYEEILDGDESALAKILSGRQYCSLASDRWEKPVLGEGNPKLAELMRILDDAFTQQRKALVFASFTATLDMLSKTLLRRYPGNFVEVLDGRTPISERQLLIDAYTEHEGFGVLLLNPRAAGVGLNIQTANTVIHFGPEWNPAVVDQATARSHRRGQSLPVFVYYLYFVDTVEETMMDRLEIKRQLMRSGMTKVGDDPDPAEIALVMSNRRRVGEIGIK